MNDLDTLLALCKKARAYTGVSTRMINGDEDAPDGNRPMTSGTTQVVRVNGGSQSHFEAEFDKDGNILSLGAWEEL